jgi:hypothetical protein
MKKIFLVALNKEGDEIDKKTYDSIEKNIEDFDMISHFVTDEYENYQDAIIFGYEGVIIIPNGSQLVDNFTNLLNFYYEQDAILLPLVLLETEKTKGVLNSCLWSPELVGQIGELDHELALKQIDLTIFGTFIPTKYFTPEFFNPSLKYYQHFYFLNKVTQKEIKVIGIPKISLITNIDLSFSSISNEEKIKYFKMAKDMEEIIPELIDVS